MYQESALRKMERMGYGDLGVKGEVETIAMGGGYD